MARWDIYLTSVISIQSHARSIQGQATGYIARMCHQQQLNNRPPTKATRPTQSKAHYVDQEEADEVGNDTSELGLFTIHTINGS